MRVKLTNTGRRSQRRRTMSAAPGCHCAKITVSSFLKHPCCNNRFIRQQQARLASTQCGSPRLFNSKFATGTAFHNAPSNGHKCSAFFNFGKSNEYKGVCHSSDAQSTYSAAFCITSVNVWRSITCYSAVLSGIQYSNNAHAQTRRKRLSLEA